MDLAQWLEKRYRRQAARRTRKQPASVWFEVAGDLLRVAHESPWSDKPLYHDPYNWRVELAIRVFHECGYRLVREEQSWRTGWMQVPERTIKLVFARTDESSSRLSPS
jgi:hypothetical protein